MQTAWLLFPDVATILCGFGLRRYWFREEAFWNGLENLVYFILFPALLFVSVTKINLYAVDVGVMPLAAASITLCGIALSALIVFWKPDLTTRSCAQCAYRFNSYIAISLMGSLVGTEGVALTAIMISAAVPIANVAAVITLAQGRGYGWGGLMRQLGTNPLILSILGGVLFNLAGGHLFEPIEAWLTRMGQSAITLGLLAVGASLRFNALKNWQVMAGIILIRHAILPILALIISALWVTSDVSRTVIVLFAAYPTASSAYILASRMGGDAPSVAVLVSLSTLLGMFSIPFWVILLR